MVPETGCCVWDEKINAEYRALDCWADDVRRTLGAGFELTLVERHAVGPLMLVAEYDVNTRIPAARVKAVIRDEADKYREGRLYFHAFDRKRKKLYLQFYAFHLADAHPDLFRAAQTKSPGR